MAVTQADVEQALRGVIDPNTGRDFVASKSVRKIAVDGDSVTVDVQLGYPAKSQHEHLKRLIHDALARLPGVARVNIGVSMSIRNPIDIACTPYASSGSSVLPSFDSGRPARPSIIGCDGP
jgi:metal-sulfur cluster biosynthetic enzyme